MHPQRSSPLTGADTVAVPMHVEARRGALQQVGFRSRSLNVRDSRRMGFAHFSVAAVLRLRFQYGGFFGGSVEIAASPSSSRAHHGSRHQALDCFTVIVADRRLKLPCRMRADICEDATEQLRYGSVAACSKHIQTFLNARSFVVVISRCSSPRN